VTEMKASNDDIYVNAPHLMSQRHRVADAMATGFMWMLYSYLWAPFVSLVAWLLGFEFAYAVMVRAGGIHVLKDVMYSYGLMVFCIINVVTAWSLANRYRYANLGRRQAGKTVTDTEIAEKFALDPKQLNQLKTARSIRLSHDEAGNIDRIETLELEDGRSQRKRRGNNDRSQPMKPAISAR
jgi:biofilm PGA synthesis protein PgaD